MKRSFRSSLAFSLVEICLAVGLFALALVGVLGLLGVATQADGDSERDTALVSMTNQVMNDLRPLPFDVLWQADPRAGVKKFLADGPLWQTPTTSPVDTEYYFDNEGLLLTGSPAAVKAKALYACRVIKTVDVDSRGYDGVKYNRLKLELKFTWPIVALEANRRSRTVYESLARY